MTTKLNWHHSLDAIRPPSSPSAAYNEIEVDKSLAICPGFAHEDLLGHGDEIFRLISGLNSLHVPNL